MFDLCPYEVQESLVNQAMAYDAQSIFEYIQDTDFEPEWVGLHSEGPYTKEERSMAIDALITAFQFAHNVRISYWTRCDLIDYFC